MAKLTDEMAQQVNESSNEGFEPIDDGVYHARLMEVDATRVGASSNKPYWSWTYKIVEEGPYTGRLLWNNTSLAENAMWKLKETYDAFGVESDVDTDDLCGRIVKLSVSKRTIQEGSRKGEVGNNIDKVLPADDDYEAPESEASPKADDIF